MVRIKTRWLLIQLDFTCCGIDENNNVENIITAKELANVVRDNLLQCSGIALSGGAQDTQVRFYDNILNIALVRTPREYCQVVRASICLITELRSRRVVITTISVKGSARTAKVEAIKKVRQRYRERLNKLIKNNNDATGTQLTKATRQTIDRICKSMEESIDKLTHIDF